MNIIFLILKIIISVLILKVILTLIIQNKWRTLTVTELITLLTSENRFNYLSKMGFKSYSSIGLPLDAWGDSDNGTNAMGRKVIGGEESIIFNIRNRGVSIEQTPLYNDFVCYRIERYSYRWRFIYSPISTIIVLFLYWIKYYKSEPVKKIDGRIDSEVIKQENEGHRNSIAGKFRKKLIKYGFTPNENLAINHLSVGLPSEEELDIIQNQTIFKIYTYKNYVVMHDWEIGQKYESFTIFER